MRREFVDEYDAIMALDYWTIVAGQRIGYLFSGLLWFALRMFGWL